MPRETNPLKLRPYKEEVEPFARGLATLIIEEDKDGLENLCRAFVQQHVAPDLGTTWEFEAFFENGATVVTRATYLEKQYNRQTADFKVERFRSGDKMGLAFLQYLWDIVYHVLDDIKEDTMFSDYSHFSLFGDALFDMRGEIISG